MIYDITQPLFECEVYPGDKQPERNIIQTIDGGGDCNLTGFYMCAHNGTHVDSPYHFFMDGKGIDKIKLEKFIGKAYVEGHEGDVTAEDAEGMLSRAEAIDPEAKKKILIKGDATVTLEAAKVFAAAGVDLVGNESQTVGPFFAPRDVHLVLLGAEVVLLEGIRLGEVPDGVYCVDCAARKLTNSEGAPCRAVLMDSC